MRPETLLTMLVQARGQLPADEDPPFLLQTTDGGLPLLLHPALPDGGLQLDTALRAALATLVQWGYLSQPAEYDGRGYLLTAAGVDYATRQETLARESTWSGVERRRQERRANERRQAERPFGVERRQVERRRI